MKTLVVAPARAFSVSYSPFRSFFSQPLIFHRQNQLFFSSFCSSSRHSRSDKTLVCAVPGLVPEYKMGIFDNFLLGFFRKKMVKEVGWDSEKQGYEGLIEVVNHLMLGRSNSQTVEASVRILCSLFPSLLIKLYRTLIAPLGEGKLAAVMVARVTALSCQWLMGPCKINYVELPDGSTCNSGVFIERCKYLEESKCIGICMNTCKLPTQSFFSDYMGVPLLMEPKFRDYSCQFSFGVVPPAPRDDSTVKEPCLEICPNADRRRAVRNDVGILQCPKA